MNNLKEMEITLISKEKRKREAYRLESIDWVDLIIRVSGILVARAVPISGVAPFGLVFLTMNRNFSLKSIISLIAVLIGYISFGEGHMLRYIGACLAFEGVLAVLGKNEKLSFPLTLISGSAIMILFDIGSMLWYGFNGGMLLLTLFDSVLVVLGICVFSKCKSLMKGKDIMTHIPTTEEKLCIFTAVAIALLSFQSINILPFFSIANLLGFVLLGIAAISGGVISSMAAGMVLAVILGINTEPIYYFAAFGVCGYICGLLSRFGKISAAAALALSGFMISILLAGEQTEIRFYETAFAAVILAVIPDFVYGTLNRFADLRTTVFGADSSYKEHLKGKLGMTAASFEKLAETFENLSDKQGKIDMQDVSALFDTAADNVCRSCSKVDRCWERDFNSTYKTMFKFLEILERKGVLTENDADPYFIGQCQKPNQLLSEINRLFEIYKINRIWKNKLAENRELVGEQFGGIAQIIRNIAEDLDKENVLDSAASEKVKQKLTEKNICVRHTEVVSSSENDRTVQITFKNQPDRNQILETIAVLEQELKGRFDISGSSAVSEKCKTLQFTEAPGLVVSSAIVCNGQTEESGDSHMINSLSGGKFIATLSDGMGTGHRASRDSGAIISLLEDFMNTGFDKKTAVKLINSIMVMKSANEAFATVDMCMVDLYSGETEFIKNGAEASYIKRKKATETVRGASLPIGIMSGIEADSFAHNIDEGDIIVMISDGIEMKNGKDGWLRRVIERTDSDISPKELADEIMEKSLELKGGVADDDMTVIVMKIEAA